ncbi:MAG: VOC family protein [Longimonas sp.]|uniref:VOC family protein n=1 Tax=Longimonas sp. TaxID=2039626 RepID=UPI00336257A2
MRPTHILETSLYASDLEAVRHFYGTVLNLPVVFDEPNRHLSFQCGDGILHVFIAEVTRQTESLPAHGADGPGHVALAIPFGQVDAWRARFDQHGISVEDSTTWPHNEQAVSLYVRDPAGNSVELATPELWGLGAGPRDAAVQRIRPHVPVDTDDQRPMEQFQSRTLRPLCKLQNPLILTTVARYLAKYNTGVAQMDRADQEAKVRNLLKEDRRLKRTLVGLIAGHFTEDEFAFYLDHQREVRRRLVALLTQRALDQLQAIVDRT